METADPPIIVIIINKRDNQQQSYGKQRPPKVTDVIHYQGKEKSQDNHENNLPDNHQ